MCDTVGFMQGDGYTFYLDVLGDGWLVWTYKGMDYGHDAEFEVRSRKEAFVDVLVDRIQAALLDGMTLRTEETGMARRARMLGVDPRSWSRCDAVRSRAKPGSG